MALSFCLKISRGCAGWLTGSCRGAHGPSSEEGLEGLVQDRVEGHAGHILPFIALSTATSGAPTCPRFHCAPAGRRTIPPGTSGTAPALLPQNLRGWGVRKSHLLLSAP